MKAKAEQSEVVKRALAMLQSPSPAPRQEALLLAEKAEKTGKPDYRTVYRQMPQAIPDDFPLVDGWLADHHPALWRKIRDLDNGLSRLEREGMPEDMYQAKQEELLSLYHQARMLRERTWGAVLIKSDVLGGEEVWLVRDEQEAQAVRKDGRAIYYRDEIELLKTKTPEQSREIHKAKLAFPGARVVQ